MNARIVIIVLAVLVGVGFAAQAVPARAAEIAEETVISATDISRLKRGLDTLQVLLNEVERQLEMLGRLAANEAVVNATLGEIRTTLMKVDATIETRKLALAEKQKATQPPAAVAQNEPTGAALYGTAGAPQLPTAAGKSNDQLASVGQRPDLTKLIWPAIIVLVVIAVIWSSRRRVVKEKTSPAIPLAPAAPPPPVELMTAPIEPIQEHPLY